MSDTTTTPPAGPEKPEAGANTAPPASAGASEPWFKGADAEIIGHLQAHGWDKKDAREAALEAVKSYREAQKLLGVPPSELVRIPRANDETAWRQFYERLGVPQKPDDYDFSQIKFSDGEPLDGDFKTWVATLAHKYHLNKNEALSFAQDIVRQMDGADAAERAEQTAKLQEEKAKLQQNWGANFEVNKFLANQAAQRLGVTPEAIAALENQIGYAAVMEMFRKIGSAMGEDTLIRGNRPAGGGVMTREEAIAKKAELMADPAWRERYLGGGLAERREMLALQAIITGVDVSSALIRA